MDRFHESVSRLPQPPLVFGSDYSVRPIPGQQGLALAAAGYREGTGRGRFGPSRNSIVPGEEQATTAESLDTTTKPGAIP